MTEIKKESADGAWLRSTLAELAGDAFPVYDLPSLQVDTNSSIQLSALADRQAAREMRQAASDVEARRLDAARVVEGLKTEAERLRGLIADGKAALRAGGPVSPDAGVASFLLPDIEAELVVAEAAEADVARERDTLLQDADRRDAAAALDRWIIYWGKTGNATAPVFFRGSRRKCGSLSTPRPTPKNTPRGCCPLPNRTYPPASVKS